MKKLSKSQTGNSAQFPKNPKEPQQFEPTESNLTPQHYNMATAGLEKTLPKAGK